MHRTTTALLVAATTIPVLPAHDAFANDTAEVTFSEPVARRRIWVRRSTPRRTTTMPPSFRRMH
jgi:hypothetical protein